MRYTYTPDGLRALAKDTGPQWAGEARAALAHAADVLEAADAVIKEAQQAAVPAWIAVSEKQPLESDGEVLVRMGDGRCEIAWATYWHGASTEFAQWMFRDPDEGEAPTHWMRIPAQGAEG